MTRVVLIAALLMLEAFGWSVEARAQAVTDHFYYGGVGTPYRITDGPDGNVWFTTDSSWVGKMTPAGTFTTYPTGASGGRSRSIVTGPDGNLWFTQRESRIGRITPAGAFTEFWLPAIGFGEGITAGPDGNLWFADRNGNAIGKITTGGSLTMYSIPTANSQPFAITAGPDGNLWFTEPNVNQIGRVSTSGVFAEFPIPTAAAFPGQITSGPDGNVWFTESDYSASKIGKVTPAGVITEYPIPTSNSRPWGILAGPDGNLWFTEFLGSKVGRITTLGVVTEYPVPAPYNGPEYLVPRSATSLWLRDWYPGNFPVGVIAVVDLSAPTATPLPGTPTPTPTPTPASAPNDFCANATAIGAIPYSSYISTAAATTSTSDPNLACLGRKGARSVWYSFTAAASSQYTADTGGSSYDTVLAVWSGTCGSLSSRACNDDNPAGGATSIASFAAVQGQTYLIEIVSYGSSGGNLALNLHGCGDGIPDPGETCDDGNTVDGDNCDSNCTPTGCGNGIRTGSEVCDDGNSVNTDACKNDCTLNVCGDMVIYTGHETCDDGNLIDGDNCDSNCTPTGCGNGVQTAGELCDDGNLIDGDNCDSNCTPSACGNGVAAPDEECDDGNLVSGDGCESDCTLPCPASFCKCLNSAGLFDITATKIDMKPDKISVRGYGGYGGTSYPVPASTGGSVCMTTGKFSGKTDGESQVGADLIATSGAGTKAAVFKGYKLYGEFQPGTFVGGDLVTGGGLIVGDTAVSISGDTDVSGSHPQVIPCSQALPDARAAAATLAALPATQTVPAIVVNGGDEYTVQAGPGIFVLSTAFINLKSKKEYGYPLGATLNIVMDPETDAVIINVDKGVTLASGSAISVNGSSEHVLLNLHSGRGAVKAAADATIDPIVLAPNGKVSLGRNVTSANLIGAKKTTLKGASVSDALACGN